eukprot:5088699-Amphidinium_carterae.1
MHPRRGCSYRLARGLAFASLRGSGREWVRGRGLLDVRVDDSMDRSVPVGADGPDFPEVLEAKMDAGAEGPEVVGAVYWVGPHACHLTDGDTRITCKKCGRYITTYK